jgi:high-affinity iron transporter
VLGYLSKAGRSDQQRSVWWGVVAAVILSLAAALGLQAVSASFEGRAEQLFEGVSMFLAAAVLTWMIFWMRSQGKQIQARLEADVEQAVAGGGSWGLFLLAFMAVVREGIETALFLGATMASSSPGQTLVGGLLGLLAAVVLGWLVFAASVRLDTGGVLRVSGMILLVVAAGLVGHGVHELQEAGALPVFTEHVWDINPVLSETSLAGTLLKSLFGYNGNPSLLEVLSYLAYWLAVGLLLVRGSREPSAEARPARGPVAAC